jgi:hypothetical protein
MAYARASRPVDESLLTPAPDRARVFARNLGGFRQRERGGDHQKSKSFEWVEQTEGMA